MTDAENYEPEMCRDRPHIMYQCPECGRRDIAVGWEVEMVLCGGCDEPMEWFMDLWTPRHHDE